MPIPPGARPEVSEDFLDAANEEMPKPVAPKPSSRKRMLKVRATRAGFIHNERKVEGSEFEVPEGSMGSWFDYIDPVEQKKHLKALDQKKQKANLKGLKDQEQELADE